MTFTNKFKDLKKFYTIFIITILFFNTALICSLHANSFKIREIEVSQDFNLDFDKKKVFDEAFKAAYVQLISTIVSSKDKKKIEKINLSTIKSLIDSFNVSDEKFLEDRYHVTVNVNFNKKNTYNYFASQNIFPSMPRKLDLIILPILIELQDVRLSEDNSLSRKALFTNFWQSSNCPSIDMVFTLSPILSSCNL